MNLKLADVRGLIGPEEAKLEKIESVSRCTGWHLAPTPRSKKGNLFLRSATSSPDVFEIPLLR